MSSALSQDVIAETPAAQGADTDIYFLRYGREVADGASVVSTSHDTLAGRMRIGDRSLLLQDVQAGAMVVERQGGQRAAIPFISRTDVNSGFSYDYRERRLTGSDGTAALFNTHLRGLTQSGPALGRDAAWRMDTDLAAIGLDGSGAPLTLNLRRTYLNNAGNDIVLLEFEVPAFQYRSPSGESVVHWARGFAVTDRDFAEIHALVTQHRSSVRSADGRIRPVSVRTSLHGIERGGAWRMTFADVPAVREAAARVLETRGDRVQQIVAPDDSQTPDPFPMLVASRIDLAAFAVAENGANPIPGVLGGTNSGMPPSPNTGFPRFDLPISGGTRVNPDFGPTGGGAQIPPPDFEALQQLLQGSADLLRGVSSGGAGGTNSSPITPNTGFPRFDLPISGGTRVNPDFGQTGGGAQIPPPDF